MGTVISVLLGGLVVTAAAQPDDADAAGAFVPAGDLAKARAAHTATLPPDGQVLVVGGEPYDPEIFASAELWEPAE